MKGMSMDWWIFCVGIVYSFKSNYIQIAKKHASMWLRMWKMWKSL